MASRSLTIGMPLYNGARYLRSSLESILSQDYGDFELIISDNASTDETIDIVRDYAAEDNRIRLVTSPVNRGGAWNFNRVLELATAPRFKWATHDDILQPGYLAAVMSRFEAAPPGSILVYPRTYIIDESGSIVGEYDDNMELLDDSPVERFRTHLENCRMVNFIFGVWDTEALRSAGGLQPWAHSDKLLVAQLALKGKFVEVPERLFLRRVHPHMSWKARGRYEGFADWFDTQRRRAVVFPTWRISGELVKTVLTMDLDRKDRAYALAAVRDEWVLKRRRLLGREVLRAPRAVVFRLFGPTSDGEAAAHQPARPHR